MLKTRDQISLKNWIYDKKTQFNFEKETVLGKPCICETYIRLSEKKSFLASEAVARIQTN